MKSTQANIEEIASNLRGFVDQSQDEPIYVVVDGVREAILIGVHAFEDGEVEVESPWPEDQ